MGIWQHIHTITTTDVSTGEGFPTSTRTMEKQSSASPIAQTYRSSFERYAPKGTSSILIKTPQDYQATTTGISRFLLEPTPSICLRYTMTHQRNAGWDHGWNITRDTNASTAGLNYAQPKAVGLRPTTDPSSKITNETTTLKPGVSRGSTYPASSLECNVSQGGHKHPPDSLENRPITCT